MWEVIAIGISGVSCLIAVLAFAKSLATERRSSGARLVPVGNGVAASVPDGCYLGLTLRNDGPGTARQIQVAFLLRDGRRFVAQPGDYLPGKNELEGPQGRERSYHAGVDRAVLTGTEGQLGMPLGVVVRYQWRDEATRWRPRKRKWRIPPPSARPAA